MAKSKRAAADSGGTPATVALSRAGISFVLRPYRHDDLVTDFGNEAAAQLGVDRRQIFKTLVADLGGGLAVAVVPVAEQLDLKALARVYGVKKAQLADPQAAARSSGYVLGGISPIGQRTKLPTVIDSSCRNFPTVLVSAGRRGLQVELAPDDLATATDGVLARITG
ncbi:Cys-tRNA(Pro) deacylase [Microlunatus sp. Gsoil 973]|uniref:Cys-tRNA(Pro) deacylase n=1 Tax=Microlunatus sp. Gsoil 973 TaxID=2672569 RepID=UPI0012B442CA|nr:Cys-tRNA(Pro) deacylase [Microlunatus sp. Gsoil 973]QGN32395.1 Cys-tRNA(Pro) deacylase [Microlunatus sp. Gsoil 973]